MRVAWPLVRQFVTVAAASDVPPGTGVVARAGGRLVAVFNVDGAFYAIDNTCLHRGGPVGDGDLEGTVVTCPWHGWQYDVTTGRNTFDPAVGLDTYAVELVGDEVRVAVE